MHTLTEIPTETLQSTSFLIMHSYEVICEIYRYVGIIYVIHTLRNSWCRFHTPFNVLTCSALNCLGSCKSVICSCHFRTIKFRIAAGLVQSVQQLATSWTVRGSNHGGGEIFRTCPDRLWPTQPSTQWVPGLSRGKAARAWH